MAEKKTGRKLVPARNKKKEMDSGRRGVSLRQLGNEEHQDTGQESRPLRKCGHRKSTAPRMRSLPGFRRLYHPESITCGALRKREYKLRNKQADRYLRDASKKEDRETLQIQDHIYRRFLEMGRREQKPSGFLQNAAVLLRRRTRLGKSEKGQ